MKRFLVTVFALWALAVQPVRPAEKAPTIVFENQSRDFGRVLEGEPLKHVFKFTNKGDALLQIEKVEPS